MLCEAIICPFCKYCDHECTCRPETFHATCPSKKEKQEHEADDRNVRE